MANLAMDRAAMGEVIGELAAVLETRKQADPERSYVASLYAGGIDKILKKIGEEATEVVMAGKDGDPQAIIAEAADLSFHLMVLLVQQGIGPEAVAAELQRRFGLSGLDEKAQRSS
jgi:phosphoribosyl-ATP pyrophosphohydrolase